MISKSNWTVNILPFLIFKVRTEQVTVTSDHDIVIMTIANTKHICSDAIAGT